MNERSRLKSAIRDHCPCDGCTERFIACSDRCPKDERGEAGYKAWKNEIARVKNEKRDYLIRKNIRCKSYNKGEEYGKT